MGFNSAFKGLTAALANIEERLERGRAGNKPYLHLGGRSQQENANYLSNNKKNHNILLNTH
jgi:hypothetical protein